MTEIYALLVLPFLIFFARVIDVSIGTIRIIFVAKGLKYLAPLVGFFEVLIWLLAIGQIIQNLTVWYYYLFYAAGFATGNFVGIFIEEKLSIGMVGIRIITKRDATELVNALKQEHFGLTVVDAKGIDERVKIIYSVVQRQCLEKIIEIVKKYNPTAFYSIEDIRFVNEALHPPILSLSQRAKSSMMRRWRKGK
ncbi:MAG: DUF2179 domain-containing protein [Candidatus Thermoplasmatota archaeon]|nr:DUF2179 domain-containing protein [Candidatus Thermoplasmatota archaeon]MBU1940655.1 DUF2179 domain-containing protein [Candidatus Thermoplasmatota archaeon]